MARFCAIDYGDVRVGVAISDPLGMLARGLETIQRKGSDERVVTRLLEIFREQEVAEIVLGLPLRTDGKSSEKADKVKAFAALLQAALNEAGLALPLHFRDERYSSVIANRILRESPSKRDKRAVVDQVAAEIILEDFLRERQL